MSKHALLSASGSARWLACPPSARLEEKFPKSTSTYANEGTVAHDVCEAATRLVLGDITKKAYNARMKKLAADEYYNAEMQECAEDYAGFIYETVLEIRETCPDALVELEAKKLDFSKWVPDGFGTADCIIVADDLLEVIDFKYGKGVKVDAENNSQMRLYGLGALHLYGELYDIKRVRMTITQPRISLEPSTEELTITELLDWAENYVRPRADLAFNGEGEFNPSEEACKFCRAKEQCRARTEKHLDLFDDGSFDPMLISPEEAGEILKKAADMTSWLKDLENFVMKTLFDGNSVEGWKLVEGRSNRVYVDDLKVAEAMIAAGYDEAALYTRKLIGITAMEKDFGKKVVGEVLKDLVHKPPGKPTLAPESDKRVAIVPEAQLLKAFDETGAE